MKAWSRVLQTVLTRFKSFWGSYLEDIYIYLSYPQLKQIGRKNTVWSWPSLALRSSLLKNLMSFSHHHDQLGGLSLLKGRRNRGAGGQPSPHILTNQLFLFQPGGQTMPTKFLFEKDFQTFRRAFSKRNESRALLELFDTVCHLASLIVTLHYNMFYKRHYKNEKLYSHFWNIIISTFLKTVFNVNSSKSESRMTKWKKYCWMTKSFQK